MGHGYCIHSFHLVHAAVDCYYYYYLNHSFDYQLIAVAVPGVVGDYFQADAVGGDDDDCDVAAHDGGGGQSIGMQMVLRTVVQGRNQLATISCYHCWNRWNYCYYCSHCDY